ncbi:MAG TPA: hypothetical protein VFJ58_23150 [Armatimonadota bacterium]|nr:hypothetical protein [Armatimonadota bacterium]
MNAAIDTSDEAIERAVISMFQQAIKDQASEIHVKPRDEGLGVGFNIGGTVHHVMTAPLYIHAPLMSKLRWSGCCDPQML